MSAKDEKAAISLAFKRIIVGLALSLFVWSLGRDLVGDRTHSVQGMTFKTRNPGAWNGQSEDEWMQRSLSALSVATMFHKEPKNLIMGDTGRVTVRIGTETPADAEHGGELIRADGMLIGHPPPRMSPKIRMALNGADFNVVPLNDEEQYISSTHPNEWAWDISAKHDGKLKLRLTPSVKLGESIADRPGTDLEIAVDVDYVQAIRRIIYDNLFKVIGAVFAAVTAMIAFFGRRFLDRRDKVSPQPTA